MKELFDQISYGCSKLITKKYSTRFSAGIFFLHKLTSFVEQFAFRNVHRPFVSIRKKYGLRAVHYYLDELAGDFTLICDLPEIFLQRKLPLSYDLSGPYFFNQILRKSN